VLLRRAEDVAPESAIAFLRQVVFNKVREVRRRTVAEPVELASAAPSPEDTLVSQQLAARVQEALACIPPSRRDVVRLVSINGRTIEQAAAAEGIPESTVRARLRDGAADLRGEMSRRRAEERRKSGFSSWLAVWGVIDLRVWIRRSLAALGAATVGGALIASTAPILPVAAPRSAIAVAPVTLAEDPSPPDLRERREAPAAAPQPAVRDRVRHDVGRRFRAERFGVE
jgi:hypothetical protein